ncbi:MAG: alpha/beta hydrolase [Candidatus Methanomethylophilaceae archaeon]|nr:alpha/beta hydrolase [Candidatus Methanomethylophilaceae archaeon]
MAVNEEEVVVSGVVSLGATIAYQDKQGKRPAIVIIMGTGKLDRDGNGPGSRMNIYRDLSDLFVEEGFVVIRYDKRGTHRSSGDFNSAGLSDLVDDAVSVTEYVKSLPYVDADKVVICGHSEGAMVATLLSEKEDVAGLMLLGGAATCLKDALRYQSRLVGEQSEEKKGIAGAILRRMASQDKTDARQDELFERCLSTGEDTIRFQGIKMSAKWVREHLSYTSDDYVGMLKAFGKPILAVTGTADLSADYSSLDSIKGVPAVTCYAPEGVNHILREIDDDNSVMKVKKQYLRLSARPIHPGTKETMVGWLSQFSGRCRGPVMRRV